MTIVKKKLRIAELCNSVAGTMEDLAGQDHNVLQLDLETQQAIEQGDGSMETVRAAVKKAVPTLPDGEIGKYTFDQLQAILMMAGAGIDAVEKAFPNAVRPGT